MHPGPHALVPLAGLAAVMVLSTLPSCAAASAGVAAEAAVNTAVGVTASAIRRASGECYTPCNPGSVCNKGTGLCEPIPCGGRCSFDEKCEATYTGDKCVSIKGQPVITPAPP